jgi:hypothetical protein
MNSEIDKSCSENNAVNLKIYEEICNSYHAIDEFRMKLLGFLPLTSLVGIFFTLTDKNIFLPPNSNEPNHLVTFVGIFAATFTLSLFIYEVRGILRCDKLIKRGGEIETELGVKGQFWVCSKEHFEESNFFNSKLAACFIYSVVFSAWLFTSLRFGLKFEIYGCVYTALGIGLAIGIGTYLAVKNRVPA